MKKVLITGITGGIGNALFSVFAENGYFVIGQYCRNSKKTEELRSSVFAKNCRFFQCDFSSPEETEKFALTVNSLYPDIDCLINNAGIAHVSLIQDETVASVSELLNVNLFAPIIVCKETVKNMISAKKGSILNISSMWGTYGGSMETVYSATKGGLNAFTKALSREVGLSSVRVNALSCGFIDTPMTSAYTDDDKNAFCENVSLARIGTPKEIASAAFFLCSDAASYITGQILGADGGF